MSIDKLSDFEQIEYWKKRYKRSKRSFILLSILLLILGFAIGVYVAMPVIYDR